MMVDNPDISYPLTKAGAAIAVAGAVNVVNLTQWLQLGAALVAFIYGTAVLLEWVWKRARRPKKPPHA